MVSWTGCYLRESPTNLIQYRLKWINGLPYLCRDHLFSNEYPSDDELGCSNAGFGVQSILRDSNNSIITYVSDEGTSYDPYTRIIKLANPISAPYFIEDEIIDDIFVTSIAVDENDNFLLAGNKSNLISLVYLDSNFNVLWNKIFDNTNNYSTKTIKTNNGFIVMANSGGSIKLYKINYNGDIIWSNEISGEYFENNLHGKEISLTIDGGFIILASEAFERYLIKTDSIGNVLNLEYE